MEKTLRGRAHTYGKNVDTDVIIPGKCCNIVDQAPPHVFMRENTTALLLPEMNVRQM